MITGLVLSAIVSLGYLFVTGTWTACLILALSGLSGTFLSGADTALLYETAVEAGGPELGRKALARASFLRLAALSVAPAVAGVLYEWHPWAPFLLNALVRALGALVVLGMTERFQPQPTERPNMWGQFRAGVAAVMENPQALVLILFGWSFFTASALVGQFGQAYFPAAGLTMAATGLVFSAANLSSTAGSSLAERLPEQGARRFLRFAPLALALAYLGMGLSHGWYGAACFLLAEVIFGILEPVYQDRLNAAIPSAQRATILSLESAGFSLLMSVAFPLAATLQPIFLVYLWVAGVGLILSALWALRSPV
jgi:hypothetical protein